MCVSNGTGCGSSLCSTDLQRTGEGPFCFVASYEMCGRKDNRNDVHSQRVFADPE